MDKNKYDNIAGYVVLALISMFIGGIMALEWQGAFILTLACLMGVATVLFLLSVGYDKGRSRPRALDLEESKSVIGEAFLPIFTDMVEGVTEVLQTFEENKDA